MNKKNSKQIVITCIGIAFIVFCVIVYTMISSSLEAYKNANDSQTAVKAEFESYQTQYNESKEQKEKDEIQLQSIKPVFETQEQSQSENLGVYGTMFEDIIKKAQYNGLLIRSIEYDMRPADDPLYASYTAAYNVCELKFFFVGSYAQLRTFMNELTKDFPYLVSFSRLNITSFSGNTDYVLINMSITLYSKKAEKKKKKSRLE